MHRFARNLVSSLILMAASFAHAGGLWIRDFGDAAQGRVSAGEAAGVESSSTVARNPAGMALLKDKQQMSISAFALYGDMKFDIESTTPIAGNDDGGSMGSIAPAAGLSYARKLNDRWSLGFGMAALTGAQITANDDWVGRYQAQKVELLGVAAVPAISWQATDKLALGVGLPIFYTKLQQDLAIPNLQDPILGPDGQARLDGDDTNVGVLLGAIYEFTERTRIGVMYQSEFDQSFGGDVDLDLAAGSASVSVDTDLNFAKMVRVGLAHALNDQLTLYAGAAWEDWSVLQDVLVTGESNGIAIPANWKDTWHADTGIRYRKSDGFEWQFGISYDSSPVDNEDRRAELPVDRQIRVGTGASWEHNERWRIGTYLTLMDLGDAKLGSSPIFRGDYDPNRILMLGVNFQFYPGR